MPELIERGHVFIAQPPLFKVAKGKQHTYLKDEEALRQYLTQSALDGASLFVNPEAPPIAGEQLQTLVDQFRTVAATIDRLSRLYAPVVLWRLVYGQHLSLDQLSDEAAVTAFAEDLSERLLPVSPKGSVYTVVVRKNQERQLFYPVVKLISHGVESDTEYTHEFFSSGEYRSMVALGNTLNTLIDEGGYFKRGDKTLDTRDFRGGPGLADDRGAQGLQHPALQGPG